MRKIFGSLRRLRHHTGFALAGLGVLMLAAFVYAMFQGGFVSWFLFYSLIPITVFIVVVALFPLQSLVAERHVNRGVFASGAAVSVTVTIGRASRWPLFFLVVDDGPPAMLGTEAGSRKVFFPGFQRKMSFTYMISDLPRGEHEWGNIHLQTGDIFGFVQKNRTIAAADQILVYPRYEEIPYWGAPGQHQEGAHRGGKSLQLDMSSVAGIRDYAPGDRLSWVDWKTTARTEKIVTKSFERPLNDHMVVFLDCHLSHYGEEQERFEQAVTVAVSLAFAGLRSGASVGFVSAAKERTVIASRNGVGQQWRIFDHLAAVRADGVGDDLRWVGQTLDRFPSGGHVAYITAQVSHRLITMLEDWALQKNKISLFLLSRQEEETNAHLRYLGIDVYEVDGDLGEALKAGKHYETS